MTQRGVDLLRGADVVAGFDAVVNVVRPLISSGARVITMGYKDQTARLEEVAVAHHANMRCVVVFMGDIHFSGFQYLERVERACGHPVETVPGISSAQILASRSRVCFDETTFVTFHRRGDLEPFKRHLVRAIADERNAIVIPRPWDFMPRDIASYLIRQGVAPVHPTEVWVNLTSHEAHWTGALVDCTAAFTDMSIMLVRALRPMPSQLEAAV
jgi:precorrin-6B methylase 1